MAVVRFSDSRSRLFTNTIPTANATAKSMHPLFLCWLGHSTLLLIDPQNANHMATRPNPGVANGSGQRALDGSRVGVANELRLPPDRFRRTIPA